MTAMTTSFPPVIVPSRELLVQEFRSDLAALAADGQAPARDLVLTQPHLLRTLAATAAGQVPRGVDRLVGAIDDAPLVTAVSLYTGLRFCLVDTSRVPMSETGPLHPGEAIALISYADDSDRRALLEHLASAEVQVSATVVVAFDEASSPSDPPPSDSAAASTSKE